MFLNDLYNFVSSNLPGIVGTICFGLILYKFFGNNNNDNGSSGTNGSGNNNNSNTSPK